MNESGDPVSKKLNATALANSKIAAVYIPNIERRIVFSQHSQGNADPIQLVSLDGDGSTYGKFQPHFSRCVQESDY